MRKLFFLLAAVFLASVMAENAWGTVYYTVTDLGTLGGFASSALGINNAGQVVGMAYDGSVQRAALFDNGTITNLGTLGGASYARGINAGGDIVGSSNTSTGYRAFLYTDGAMSNLGTLAGDFESYARAINSDGQVVGYSLNASYLSQAFLYSEGTMSALGTLPGHSQSSAFAINDNGQVVGSSYNTHFDAHAYLYSDGTMNDLGTLGGTSSYGRGINASGQVVGYSPVNGADHAFLYSEGTMTDLGTLSGLSSYGRGINSSGQVVGYSSTARPGIVHAFLYDEGSMTDLRSLIDPASRWSLRYATAINDSGAIVGTGINPSGRVHGFLLTPIARDYASLSLPSSLTDFRMMQDGTATSGSAAVAIAAPGNIAVDFTIASSGLTVDPASGTVAPAAVTNVPLSLAWNDTATTGSRTGSITLTNVTDPTDPGNHATGVAGAVVANRVLNVAPIGSSSAPARVMARALVTTTISSGDDPAGDADDAATRLNTVANGRATDGVATVTYAATQPAGTLLSKFDGLSQTANLGVTFSKTGYYTNDLDLASAYPVPGSRGRAFLADAEAKSVGAELQPAVLSYEVEVLEPRRLRASVGRLQLGNVLRGATVSTNFVVTSTNRYPDAEHTTMVNVAPGGTALGELTAGEVLVSSGDPVNVPLTGTLNTYGRLTVSGLLPVATAEDASVNDTTSYRSLGVYYAANVGIARFGSIPTSFDSGETILSATIAPASAMVHLSSKVTPTGTLANNLTSASWIAGPASLTGIYGAVGSEAEIVASTTLDADATVTMQWRKRLRAEAHYPNTPISPTLPSGQSWLTSDIVKIGGVTSGVTYALNMSFDNRINLAFDGQTNGSVPNELPGLYIAEFDNAANHWVNATTLGTIGDDAQQGILQSLSGFLAANADTPLADLQGSWGVDPFTNTTGLGHSWAIVASGGSGVFAVDPSHSATLIGPNLATVPEPGTRVLLAIAAFGLAALGWRKR